MIDAVLDASPRNKAGVPEWWDFPGGFTRIWETMYDAAPAASTPSELSDAECDALIKRLLIHPLDDESVYSGKVIVSNVSDLRALIRAGRATVAEDAARYRWACSRMTADEVREILVTSCTQEECDRRFDAARGKP